MHLNLERHVNHVISPYSLVKFDQVVNESVDSSSSDFKIEEDGSIQILRVGVYFIKFFTAQMSGLSASGNYFTLVYKRYNSDSVTDYEWRPFEIEEDAETLPADSKSVPLVVTETSASLPFTIALKNITATNVKLSPYEHVKAAMIIFGLPPLEGEDKEDVETLCQQLDLYESEVAFADLVPRLNRLNKMESWQDTTLSVIDDDLEAFIATYTDYYRPKPSAECPSEKVRGISLFHIIVGYAYSFWGGGQIVADVTLPASGEKLMLVPADLSPALLNYQGEPCVCPCLCQSDTLNRWIPIYFDNTGIYFINPPRECMNAGVTLNFTQTLILAQHT